MFWLCPELPHRSAVTWSVFSYDAETLNLGDIGQNINVVDQAPCTVWQLIKMYHPFVGTYRRDL